MPDTIFIIPGAWHPAFTFDLLVSALKHTHQLEAFATTLPTTASPPSESSPNTLADDVAHIRGVLVPRIEAGEEFVVICHSYGGIPGSEALHGLGLGERKTTGKSGGVKRIIYVASYILPEGGKVLEGSWDHSHEDLGVIAAPNPLNAFYNDVEPVLAESMASRLLPMALSAFKTPQKHAAWRTIPSAYVLCELDNALPPAKQESMAKDAGLDSKDIIRLKTGHSPFLSRVDELAGIVSDLVNETVETKM